MDHDADECNDIIIWIKNCVYPRFYLTTGKLFSMTLFYIHPKKDFKTMCFNYTADNIHADYKHVL